MSALHLALAAALTALAVAPAAATLIRQLRGRRHCATARRTAARLARTVTR